MKLTSFELYE
jgi:hypothetical protein